VIFSPSFLDSTQSLDCPPPSSHTSVFFTSFRLDIGEDLFWAAFDGLLPLVVDLCELPELDPNWQRPLTGSTPLFVASQEGQTDVVKHLLAHQGIVPDLANHNQATPFFIACQQGKLEVVQLLLADSRVDPARATITTSTPLFSACQNGHIEIVELLLKDGRVNPNKANGNEATPFYVVCQCGHKDLVKLMLADPRVDPTKTQKDGATPFFAACQQGHLEIVKLLLADPRVDPDQPDNENYTPFFISCQEGQREVALKLLLDQRVNPNHPDGKNNATPLYIAAQNGNLDIVQLIFAHRSGIITTDRVTCDDPDENGKMVTEWVQALPSIPQRPYMNDETYERVLKNGPATIDLIQAYERDPLTVMSEVRKLSGIRGHFVGRTFALLVFFADGFLRLRKDTPAPVANFLKICSTLPLEVQMVLVQRMFGSTKDLIASKDSEPGFRWLASSKTWGIPPQ